MSSLKATFILLVGAAFLAPTCAAQNQSEQPARHAVYLEGYGPTVGHSINYEYAFSDSYRLRAGFSPCRHTEGCWTGDFEPYSTAQVSAVASRLFRHEEGGKDGFEVGGGLMLAEGATEKTPRGEFPPTTLYGTLLIGYRYQPVAGGVVFRVGLTPVIGLSEDADDNSLFWGGVSLGYAF